MNPAYHNTNGRELMPCRFLRACFKNTDSGAGVWVRSPAFRRPGAKTA